MKIVWGIFCVQYLYVLSSINFLYFFLNNIVKSLATLRTWWQICCYIAQYLTTPGPTWSKLNSFSMIVTILSWMNCVGLCLSESTGRNLLSSFLINSHCLTVLTPGPFIYIIQWTRPTKNGCVHSWKCFTLTMEPWENLGVKFFRQIYHHCFVSDLLLRCNVVSNEQLTIYAYQQDLELFSTCQYSSMIVTQLLLTIIPKTRFITVTFWPFLVYRIPLVMNVWKLKHRVYQFNFLLWTFFVVKDFLVTFFHTVFLMFPVFSISDCKHEGIFASFSRLSKVPRISSVGTFFTYPYIEPCLPQMDQ